MKLLLQKHYQLIITAILLFMATVSILNAWWDTAIFDETAHIPAGYSYLTRHETRLNPEHPPLIKDLAGFPLIFMNLNFDTSKSFWTGDLPRKWDEGQWAAGRHLLWESGNNPDAIIFWSRIPIIILSLILGLFIFRWARELTGIIGGLFALMLYAFDPNILGHNHFVTTDLGIAAFMTFAFYYFLRFIKDPSWKNAGLAGIFVGLLQLTKFSSIIAFPIFGLIAIAYPLVKITKNSQNQIAGKMKFLGEYIGKGAIIFALSLIVVWTVYAANTYKTSENMMSQIIDFNFSPEDSAVKNIYTNKVLHALNENVITRPMVEYGIGMGYVFRRVAGGNGAYFMGEVSGSAFPFYFPTVFLLKESLAFLFLIVLSIGLVSYRYLKHFISNLSSEFNSGYPKLNSGGYSFIRHNIIPLTILLFVILYSYMSITGNLNIGFRHLFPILPFIYILVTLAIFGFIKRIRDTHTKNIWAAIIYVPIALLIVETVSSYPYYMSYFNPLAGGPKNGYRYVTDSNADWGQDLRRLEKWIQDYNNCTRIKCDASLGVGCPKYCYTISNPVPEHGKSIDKIRVDYFGGGDIKHYLGDKYVMWWDSKRPAETGWYALSTNFLQGSIYDETKPDDKSYRWLQDIEPVAQVGTSIFIYYVPSEPLINP